jgi:hypothetical protein
MPDLMRSLDCFVPSQPRYLEHHPRGHGLGFAIVATAVGGNPELVEAGRSGRLVPRQIRGWRTPFSVFNTPNRTATRRRWREGGDAA